MNDDRLWTHPAILGKHLVTHTRDYPDGAPYNVSTCQCGWTHRETVGETARRFLAATVQNKRPRDPVDDHWRDVIAKAEGRAA